jgi:DNA polymerase III epsilon subunit-like protein
VGDAFFSIDVETSGPVPGAYSLLAIGACRVDDPAVAFYTELQPESEGIDPDAVAVSGLSIERLMEEGEPADRALTRFAEWVEDAAPPGDRAVFVGFNAPFDWMFVAEALHRHVGRNPFGHAPLDIKALAMGATGIPWEGTSFAALAARYGLDGPLPHHALEDARLQAVLFQRICDEGERR